MLVRERMLRERMLRERMQPAPRTETDRPRVGIGARPLVGRLGPRRGVGADEFGPVPPWSAGRGLRPRVGGEAAAGPQADQARDRRVRHGQSQLHGVIARIEAEDRQRAVPGSGRRLLQPRTDLLSGHRIDVLAGDQSTHAQRRGPPRTAVGHLHQPGIVPTRDNGLPVGVAVGGRIVAALWAGFGIAARPDARIDGVPSGVGRERMGGDELLKRRPVHGAGVEGIGETAPAALTARHQTEMGGRLDGGGVSMVGAVRSASSSSNRASRRHPNSG